MGRVAVVTLAVALGVSGPGVMVPIPVPLFTYLAANGENLQSYTVPIQLIASLHKLIFTFHYRLNGTVSFEQPDTLHVTIEKVPERYARVFDEIGAPRMWPLVYDLQIVRSNASGNQPVSYELVGVPRETSDIDHVTIWASDPNSPIRAQWVLRSGWNVMETIDLEDVQGFLVPGMEHADITGHGYRIHTDITYGSYVFNSADAGE